MSRNFQKSFDILMRQESKNQKSRSFSKIKENEIYNTIAIPQNSTGKNRTMTSNQIHFQSQCLNDNNTDTVNKTTEHGISSKKKYMSMAIPTTKVTNGKNRFIPFRKIPPTYNNCHLTKKKINISLDNSKSVGTEHGKQTALCYNVDISNKTKVNKRNIRSKFANLTCGYSPDKAIKSYISPQNNPKQIDNYFLQDIILSAKNASTNKNTSSRNNEIILSQENTQTVLFHQLKAEFDHFKEQKNRDITEINSQLAQKDKEIQHLIDSLENKERYIKDIEVILTDLKKILSDQKTYKDKDSEIEKYSHRQIIRTVRNIKDENKMLHQTVSRMEGELEISKEKDMRIMHLLHILKKNGLPIDEMLEMIFNNDIHHDNLINPENSLRSDLTSQSCNSSTNFIPITVDPQKTITKPKEIPNLNLKNINMMFNAEYSSTIGEYQNENNNHQDLIKNKEVSDPSSIRDNVITNPSTNTNPMINSNPNVNNTETNAFNTLEVASSSCNNDKEAIERNKMMMIHMTRKSLFSTLFKGERIQTGLKDKIANMLKKKTPSRHIDLVKNKLGK